MINIGDIPKTGGVYKIISPNNKIYIGKTINLHQRFQKYSRLICEQQSKLYNSFKKYGFENHSLEILLLSQELKELNSKEIFFIKELNTYNSKHGLNLTEGGDGRSGKHSQSAKRKISESIKNSKKFYETMRSSEYRKKISDALIGHPGYGKGIKRQQEIVEKIKKGVQAHLEKFGTRKHTEESKIKMSKKRKGENNNNAKKCSIIYNNEVINFNCQKYIKEFINKINEDLKLVGKNRYSYYSLIDKGSTKDIHLIINTEFK